MCKTFTLKTQNMKLEKLKKTRINEEIYHVYGLEFSLLLRYRLSPKYL